MKGVCFILSLIFLVACYHEIDTQPHGYSCQLSVLDEAGNDLVEDLLYGGQPNSGGLYEVWMRDYSLNSPTKDARVSPIWVDRETIPMVLTINAEFSQKWDEWGEDKEISYTLQYPKLFGDESEHTLTTYHANDSCFQIVLDGQTYQPDSTGVFRIVWSGAGK